MGGCSSKSAAAVKAPEEPREPAVVASGDGPNLSDNSETAPNNFTADDDLAKGSADTSPPSRFNCPTASTSASTDAHTTPVVTPLTTPSMDTPNDHIPQDESLHPIPMQGKMASMELPSAYASRSEAGTAVSERRVLSVDDLPDQARPDEVAFQSLQSDDVETAGTSAIAAEPDSALAKAPVQVAAPIDLQASDLMFAVAGMRSGIETTGWNVYRERHASRSGTNSPRSYRSGRGSNCSTLSVKQDNHRLKQELAKLRKQNLTLNTALGKSPRR